MRYWLYVFFGLFSFPLLAQKAYTGECEKYLNITLRLVKPDHSSDSSVFKKEYGAIVTNQFNYRLISEDSSFTILGFNINQVMENGDVVEVYNNGNIFSAASTNLVRKKAVLYFTCILAKDKTGKQSYLMPFCQEM